MEYIDSYKNYYKGKTCAILGGGTSLPFDMKELPDVDILIGVNQHSVILPLDFIVFVDRHMWPYLKDYDATFITKVEDLEDIEDQEVIVHRQIVRPNYSGNLAIKAADYMGFSKIYVCGVDQYEGHVEGEPVRYWWWEAVQTAQKRKGRAHHDNPDELLSFIRSLKRPQNVYFVSGRLKELHQ
tara:strand:+ start:2257 stop:2805 length:549 start_codon:yes stop_codon:yes gene_type:complete